MIAFSGAPSSSRAWRVGPRPEPAAPFAATPSTTTSAWASRSARTGRPRTTRRRRHGRERPAELPVLSTLTPTAPTRKPGGRTACPGHPPLDPLHDLRPRLLFQSRLRKVPEGLSRGSEISRLRHRDDRRKRHGRRRRYGSHRDRRRRARQRHGDGSFRQHLGVLAAAALLGPPRLRRRRRRLSHHGLRHGLEPAAAVTIGGVPATGIVIGSSTSDRRDAGARGRQRQRPRRHEPGRHDRNAHQGLGRGLSRRPGGTTVPPLRHDARFQRHHRGCRRRPLRRRRRHAAPADGGLPPEGQVWPLLHAASLHRPGLHRRALLTRALPRGSTSSSPRESPAAAARVSTARPIRCCASRWPSCFCAPSRLRATRARLRHRDLRRRPCSSNFAQRIYELVARNITAGSRRQLCRPPPPIAARWPPVVIMFSLHNPTAKMGTAGREPR